VHLLGRYSCFDVFGPTYHPSSFPLHFPQPPGILLCVYINPSPGRDSLQIVKLHCSICPAVIAEHRGLFFTINHSRPRLARNHLVYIYINTTSLRNHGSRSICTLPPTHVPTRFQSALQSIPRVSNISSGLCTPRHGRPVSRRQTCRATSGAATALCCTHRSSIAGRYEQAIPPVNLKPFGHSRW